jgi:hypothetical protein
MLVFDSLKRMKPMRRIAATELMVAQKNLSSPFIRNILPATSDRRFPAFSSSQL